MPKIVLPQLIVIVMLYFTLKPNAQNLNQAQLAALAEQQLPQALLDLKGFMELPNLSRNMEHIRQNMNWCLETFQALNFSTTVLTTDEIPFVLAEKSFGKTKTVLFYLQIDGQPVDPAEWNQEDPFKPVLKQRNEDDTWEIIPWSAIQEKIDPEWRIFGRSASDSKGPAMSFISALKILEQENIQPDFNIKVIMDFQEEISSPKLPPTVQNNQKAFQSDMLVVMDGARHISNLPTLAFGARGIATATLKVYGANNALHSGQYGNFAPNPVFKLSKLIAAMKDDDGRVLIPGFYEGVHLSETEKKILAEVPEDLPTIQADYGIAAPEKVGATLQEALQYPTLNIRGLKAAWVGKEVRTIIPDEAIAEIDMRLVPESDGERLMGLLRQFVVDQGYHLTDGEPTDQDRATYPKLASFTYKVGYSAYRTEFDSPIGQWLVKAHLKTYGDYPVRMRTTGGSQPISPFISTLGIPAVSVRIPNPDNNIHGPDENFRIQNYIEGIRIALGILTESL
jgi:acetylornithine deacetylase/succinyl-diaminopimelate desuccinylase-like protein